MATGEIIAVALASTASGALAIKTAPLFWRWVYVRSQEDFARGPVTDTLIHDQPEIRTSLDLQDELQASIRNLVDVLNDPEAAVDDYRTKVIQTTSLNGRTDTASEWLSSVQKIRPDLIKEAKQHAWDDLRLSDVTPESVVADALRRVDKAGRHTS